ncbi:hypothetical protein BH10ACI1_BH10ACI1_20340 [soil metagenome]
MKILEARQEAKLNMYEVVEMLCDANPTIIATIVAFVAAYNEFKALIANINTAAQLSSAVLTGIAADKKVSKLGLSQIAAKIAGQIFAYSAKNGNNTLKAAVNFSVSDLSRMKDGELAALCQTIHDKGIENKDVLTDYGVTTAKLAELQAAINAYAESVPKPRTAITERSTTKANIKQMFKDADSVLLEQMDKLVEDFAEDFPDFVSNYKNARIIVDPKPKKKKSGNEAVNNPPA